MIPIRTRAPLDAVVLLADLKAHLRVDHDDDDALIDLYEQAAVSYLDGYRGILGRCILEQDWTVSFSAPGRHRLPLPDVVAVTASAGTAVLSHDHLGSIVELSAPATVTMTCALPPDALRTVRMAIKLMVSHWYEHREAATEVTLKETPMAANSLLAPIRWIRL